MSEQEVTDQGKTIGDQLFGLESAEAHARFGDSLYRDVEDLRDLGTVDPSLTYWDIADAILDTVINYTGMGEVPATELSTLVRDAVEQLAPSDEETQFSENEPEAQA